MEELLEAWPEQPRRIDVHVGSPVRPTRWNDRRLFLLKSALLLATTIALIPILAWQHQLAAKAYVAFLIIVHIAGLAIFAYGLRREHWGQGARGLAIRVGGLLLLTALLYLASKGLSDTFGSLVFWVSLTAIWVLHTAGAAMLHFGGSKQGSLCPFF